MSALPQHLFVAPPVDPSPGGTGALSPSQVRTFIDCQAKWRFKYRLNLPDPPTSSLALGRAVHAALAENFRQKLDSAEDLPVTGVVALFRLAWSEERGKTTFREDEDADAMGRSGEELVRTYMNNAAPQVQPIAVEIPVAGQIGGVPVRGIIDLIDSDRRIVDFKVRSRRPTAMPPADVFQLTTYRQLVPAAADIVRIDSLIHTKSVQLVHHSREITSEDRRVTTILYPLVREAMHGGIHVPNRLSLYCSRRHCAFWRECERHFGGQVREV